jgi:hypothetical protein
MAAGSESFRRHPEEAGKACQIRDHSDSVIQLLVTEMISKDSIRHKPTALLIPCILKIAFVVRRPLIHHELKIAIPVPTNIYILMAAFSKALLGIIQIPCHLVIMTCS